MVNSVTYITHYSGFYGANRSLFSLVKERAALGCKDVVVMPEDGVFRERLAELSVEIIICSFPLNYHAESPNFSLKRLVKQWLTFLYGFYKILLLKNTAKKLKHCCSGSELVHTNSSLTELGVYLSKLLGVPHIWHIREFGDLDYHFYYDLSERRKKSQLNSSAYLILVGDELKKHHGVEENKKAITIRNGVLSRERAEAIDWKRERTDLIIIIAGYLAVEKGQHRAIRAFKEIVSHFPNATLKIIGAGGESYERSLKELVRSLDLEKKVLFTGNVNDVSPYYLESAITFMCSRNEAMGRVTPEAMLHGSVVVGYNNAGTAEIITDGVNGVLYDEKKTNLATVTMELWREQQQYLEVRNKAYEYAMHNFIEETQNSKIFDLYEEVLDT